MTTINLGDGNCAECKKGPVRIGIPVFRNPPRQGGGGVDTEIWCIDCIRRLLHQEGEDIVVGG